MVRSLTLDEQTVERIRSVLKRYDVRRAAIFGSMARGEATEASDLDLLVEFPRGKSLLDLVQLEFDLTETVGASVDVVTYNSLHPLIREKVIQEQVPILCVRREHTYSSSTFLRALT